MGMPIGLMTGKDRERNRGNPGSTLGTEAVFFCNWCGDDAYPGKRPRPGRPLWRQTLAVLPEKTVIVGDSVLDVQCGLAARIPDCGCYLGL